MAESSAVPYGHKTQKEPAVPVVHVLWSPDGLGCDGDTISTTAATQPSIEDIVMGAIPGLPKVHLHNRVLAYSLGGEDYLGGVLSHHVVIRDGRIANYHPYPPTPWNANPRDAYGTPGPYEDAVQNTPIFEENGPDTFKGIDIMRAVRSFDPCLPCGVHMYTGGGKMVEVRHVPMFGAHG
jgi:hypothetical protein